MKAKNGSNASKEKAQAVSISRLVVLSAYGKTFSSGKPGFFGKVMDPDTGKKYQVIGAVEISS